jgi:hypothetical protein
VRSQLNLVRTHEFDVFFHFWETVDGPEKQRILDAYRPKAYRFDPPADLSHFDRLVTRLDNINCPSRMMSMYSSWRGVAALFDGYRRATSIAYDFAVRLRADLLFLHPLDPFFPQLGPNDLLVSRYNHFGLINDMFALGGVGPILYYHTLADRALTYQNEIVFNPEVLLDHHLRCGPPAIRLLEAHLPMLVFRPHMVGMPIEECLKEHPGASKWRDREVVAAFKDFHGRRNGARGVEHVERFRLALLAALERAKARRPRSSSPPS